MQKRFEEKRGNKELKIFKVYMNPIEIEAKDRDDAIDQLGEMVMPDPCGLFEVEEIKKND